MLVRLVSLFALVAVANTQSTPAGTVQLDFEDADGTCSFIKTGDNTNTNCDITKDGLSIFAEVVALKAKVAEIDLKVTNLMARTKPASCVEVYENGQTASGQYEICPEGVCFNAYCDQTHEGGGWTLVTSRGDCQDGNCPHATASYVAPMSATGAALEDATWMAIKATATEFAINLDGGACTDAWGFGEMSKLTSGNNCENLGDTLTTCNMIHNEGAGNGCAYSGSDYNGFFGVSSSIGGYTDRCNYFSENIGVFNHWSTGATCAQTGYYAPKADLYVRAKKPFDGTYPSCREMKDANPDASDGTYTIVLSDSSDLEVYCDMTSDGGGWTLLANQQQTSNNCQSGAVGTFTSLAQSSSYRLSDDQIADIQGSGDGHFRYKEPNYNSCSGDGACTDSVYWKYDAGVGTKNHDFHSNTGTSGFNKNGNLHHCSTKLNGDYYGEDGGTCYRYDNGSNDDGTGANNGLCGYTSHYGLDTWATGGPHNGHCGMYFIWCYGSELYRDGAASSTTGHLWVR